MQTARDTIEVPQDGSAVVQWAYAIDGTPVDFTGWSGSLSVRKHHKRQAALVLEVALAFTDEGTITADLDAATMLGKPAGTYWFDTRCLDPDGRPTYPLAGPFIVNATVTAPGED